MTSTMANARVHNKVHHSKIGDISGKLTLHIVGLSGHC